MLLLFYNKNQPCLRKNSFMKTILFFIVIITATTIPLTAMFSSKPIKKKPTEKCYEGIQLSDPKKIKHAIKKGADVNAIYKSEITTGQNLLQMALNTNKIKIIKILLNAPTIDPNNYPPNSSPPLHWTIINGKWECLKLLLSHPKININVLDENGNTSLFAAIHSYFTTLSIEKMLLNNKLDITIANKEGNTILHHVCRSDSFLVWLPLLLIAKNCPVNAQNKQNNTPLHLACHNNAFQTVKAILASEHSVKLELCNLKKKSAFDIALDKGFYKIISLFLNKYANKLIQVYSENEKLFDYAICANNPEILKQILPSPYINSHSYLNRTPLMLASEEGYAEIVTLLLEQKNCIPLEANYYGRIALHYAAQQNHFECVKKLCEYGGLDRQDHDGNTPIYLASLTNQVQIIDYLIKKGANTLIKNEKGFVPFLIIYQKNIQNKIEKTILNNMIQAKDENNNSLFHILAEISHLHNDKYDYDNCLEFLMKKGLNLYAQNNNQFTALDMLDKQYTLNPIPSRIMLSFWRVASNHRQCSLFKKILKTLPKELRTLILTYYYKLNIKTIFAKINKLTPSLLDPHDKKSKYNFTQLANDLHYFPLLYRPVVPFLG